MRRVKEVFLLSCEYLKKKGIENYKFSTETIIAKVLKCNRLDVYLSFEKFLEKEELQKIRKFLQRRLSEPLEYIFPKIEFYNSILDIDENVLIPRQETELLVENIIKKLSKESLENKSFFDIGTGSGCIAISIKKRFPSLNVFASDVSKKALLVAKKNAVKNKVDINFFLGDLFEPFSQKADFLASNPPYVSLEDYKKVSLDVQKEPKIALLAGDGFLFYQRMEEEMPKYLKKGSKIFFEIGHGQGKEIFSLFSKNHWVKKEILKDFSNIDRFFFLEFN